MLKCLKFNQISVLSKQFLAWSFPLVFGLFVSPLARGAEPTLPELIQIFQNMPRNEQEMTTALTGEVFQQNRDLMDALFQGARPGEMNAFVNALTSHSNDESLVRMSEQMERHQMTTVRFLVEVAQRVRQQPALLAKIETRLRRLETLLEQREIPRPAIGQRVMTSTLYVAGIMSYLYSIEATFSEPYLKRHLASSLHWMSTFFGFHFFLALAGEWNVLKQGVPAYLQMWKNWKQTRSYISDLRGLTEELKRHPLIDAQLKQMEYFASEAADRDALEIVTALGADVALQSQRNLDLGRVTEFSRTRVFLDLVQRFRQRLTQEELAELQGKMNRLIQTSRDSEGEDMKISLGLRAEIARFEQQVREELERFLAARSNESRTEIYSEMAELLDEKNRAPIRGTRPTRWTQLSWVGLSLSATLLGLSASVGIEATPLDRMMPLGIAEFLRSNISLVHWTSAFFALPALTQFYWNFNDSFRKYLRTFRSSFDISLRDRLRAVTRVLNSKDVKSDSAKSIVVGDVQGFIERVVLGRRNVVPAVDLVRCEEFL